jgi:hypothetical protein
MVTARLLRSISRETAHEIHRSPRARRVRAWEVVHTCDFARDIADIVEAQIAAGMRAYLLTVGADVSPKASVLQTWQDVRRWKKALDESGARTTPQLIHAHSFASGMAAVRMGACVVYDLRIPVEECLATSTANNPGAWMSRSFRTAEQFVLSKAAAVVVHSRQVREECIGRGVAAESVFHIEEPVLADSEAFFQLDPAQQKEALKARSPQHVAEKYDEVYRYAFSRRNNGQSGNDSSGALIPIPAGI